MGTRLHNYREVRAYLEKEHPDWLLALTPRHINAPAEAEDFVDKLWLLSITLVLIMVSCEELVERGRLEKTRKPKSGEGKPIQFWSPNFPGRLYQSALADEGESRSASTQQLHWRRGHIKAQPHGPGHSLRKIIWIRPYRVGRD